MIDGLILELRSASQPMEVGDLESSVEDTISGAREALKKKELLPYRSIVKFQLGGLKRIRKELMVNEGFFMATGEEKLDAKQNIAKVEEYIMKIGTLSLMFDDIESMMMRNINFEVLKDYFLGEQIQLSRARLIVPTRINSDKIVYLGFSAYIPQGFKNSGDVEMDWSTRYIASSLREAIEKNENLSLLCTNIVVKGSEFYPLKKSVIPILKRKYLDFYRGLK